LILHRLRGCDKDAREYLKGACLSWRNGHVILTATDGHTVIACRVAEGVDQFAPVILPSDLLKKIGANKGPVTCEINVTDSATHIVLEQGYATYRGLTCLPTRLSMNVTVDLLGQPLISMVPSLL